MGFLITLIPAFLNPKNWLYAFIGIATVGAGYGLYHVVSNYQYLEDQQVKLTADLKISTDAYNAQLAASKLEQQTALDDLNSVRAQVASAAATLAQAQSDLVALRSIRKPTNEDVVCSRSPYVSTILDRMRKRSPSTGHQSHRETGSKVSSIGAHNMQRYAKNPASYSKRS